MLEVLKRLENEIVKSKLFLFADSATSHQDSIVRNISKIMEL